jgi:hypothetical protein
MYITYILTHLYWCTTPTLWCTYPDIQHLHLATYPNVQHLHLATHPDVQHLHFDAPILIYKTYIWSPILMYNTYTLVHLSWYTTPTFGPHILMYNTQLFEDLSWYTCILKLDCCQVKQTTYWRSIAQARPLVHLTSFCTVPYFWKVLINLEGWIVWLDCNVHLGVPRKTTNDIIADFPVPVSYQLI